MKFTKNGTTKPLELSTNGSTATGSLARTWRWVPVLSLTSAVGIFLLALAADAGRFVLPEAQLLFWVGLVVLFLPIGVRVMLAKPTRRERITLLLLLGSGLYLIRFLDYPLSFAYDDEFAHWQGAYDLATTGHLFQVNPLIPIIPYYPGLEIVTNALNSLTGLSIFASGSIVLIVAGWILVLSLYLLFEHISNSAQTAGIATLLCMANPGLFSDTQFAYESLALPLAVFVLFLVARRAYIPSSRSKALTLVTWLGLAAVVITHHVTSFGLVAFLFLWMAVFLFLWIRASLHRSHNRKRLAGPGWSAIVGFVLIIVWLVYTGERAIPYLFPAADTTVRQATQLLMGEQHPRHLLQDGAGSVSPLWERAMAFASVALISLGLPFGLFALWRQHYRINATAIALAIGATMYPISQLALLTPIGDATVGRAQEFLFLAVTFILAIGIIHFWFAYVPSKSRYVTLVGAITVILIGGWVTGTGSLWYRLPGPYLVSADHRSIGPEGIAAAEWAASYLGPGHRVVGARADSYLMGTYGYQSVVTIANDKIEVAPVFTSLQFGSVEEGILKGVGAQYLVVDLRLSTDLPHTGSYFNVSETNAQHHDSPIKLAALTKFDAVPNANQIYDSGDIIVYDVEAITNGSSAPSCIPRLPIIGPFPSSLQIAPFYIGTTDNVETHHMAEMSLIGIQQQRGSICGTFNGFGTTLPVEGNITPNGSMQFVATNDAGQTVVTFEGHIQPDGTLSGSFCHPEAGQCDAHGLWSLSPGM